MIGLIDFDGTVVYQTPEKICEVDTGAEAVLKELLANDHQLVLWTCRNHSLDNPYNYYRGVKKDPDSLDEALEWFKKRDIPLLSVNSVPDSFSKRLIGTSNKPLCDFVIDDLNIGTPLKFNKVIMEMYDGNKYAIRTHCVDWKKIREELQGLGII